jgi:hypothetical protein
MLLPEATIALATLVVVVPELPTGITMWGIEVGAHVAPRISNSRGNINQIVKTAIILGAEYRS